MKVALARREEVERAIGALVRGYGLTEAEALHALAGAAERLEVRSPEEAFKRIGLRTLAALGDLQADAELLTDAEVAEKLQIPKCAILDLREKNEIFGLQRQVGDIGYPAWQIRNGSLLPGLSQVLRALVRNKVSPAGILLFFLTDAEALSFRRPVDLLGEGDISPVVVHAERYGVIGS